MPELVRGGGASSVARSVSLMGEPRLLPSVFEAGPADSGASSTIVFHAPQASQRPDHLLKDAPQALQEKLLDFAMTQSCPSGAGRSNPEISDLPRPGFLARRRSMGIQAKISKK